jgi:hypothetical protein
MKINVIGSGFYDRIYQMTKKGLKERINMGGIFNIDLPKANFYVTDVNNYDAIINKYGAESHITWSKEDMLPMVKTCLKNTESAYITHFSYLNTILGNIDVSDFDSKIKSCDLSVVSRDTVNQELVLKNITKCDITFLSSDLIGDYEKEGEYLKCSKNNISVIHGYGICWVLRKNAVVASLKYEVKEFKYTIGAGDHFAGYFIDGFVNGLAYKDNLVQAHKRTLEWLEKVNEEV